MFAKHALQVTLTKKPKNATPDAEDSTTDPAEIAKIAGGMIKETLVVAAIGVGALIVLNAACQIAVNALKADDK
jgi:hypothetical protein